MFERAGQYHGYVLVADNHKCSIHRKHKIPDKLAVTPLKQCQGFLFSKFISHMIVPAPADIALGTPLHAQITRKTQFQHSFVLLLDLPESVAAVSAGAAATADEVNK